jgi:drug/metabolite transporter (DMT)-like permease
MAANPATCADPARPAPAGPAGAAGVPAGDGHRARAVLALGAGIACIGFSAIFVKLAGMPGPVSALWRVVIAGAALLPWWLVRRPPLPAPRDLGVILAAGVFFGIDIGLWNTSIMYTTAATATLLANNSPVWVGLASFFLFREKLSGLYWLGLAVALAGSGVLVGGDAFRHLRLDPGNLLAIAASFFYAAYILTTGRARTRVGLTSVMTLSTFASIATLLVINLAMGTRLTGYPGRSWMALLGLGLISQLGGWLAINYALGHLRAAPVSVALLSQVVVTALVAMPILGEFMQFHQMAGGALVLAGVYLVTWGRSRPPAEPAEP